MKTPSHSTFRILPSAFPLLAALTLLATAPFAQAQGDSVTISAAEFQRMVYASHLQTQMDEKPELDASLQVLLELQRRNPQADPAALAGLLQEATARYRTNAPAYLRTRAFRDEVLAAYLEALRQVPARTNFIPVNLTLLNYFMLKPADYAQASAAELVHAGNQRLLTAEETIAQREELVEACTQRGWVNPAFGAAMDDLMWPEIGVVLAHTPAQILSVNSALSNTPTMQEMLYRSSQSGDGSVTLSTNELKNLFAQEMGTMHEIINTNLAVDLAILETQTDLPSYLTNSALIQTNLQRENAVKQGQPQRLAAASAAVNQVSRMTASKLPAVGQAMGGLGRGVKSIADGLKGLSEAGKLMKAAACGNFVAGGLQIVGAILDIAGVFQDPNDVILQEIGQVKEMIADLSNNMNYRFDRVDRSLNQVLDQVSYSIDLIGEVGHDVDQVRQGLVDVQTDLHRLEQHLLTYVNQLYTRGLNLDFNTYLGYEATYGDPMPQADYNTTEADFFTHARNNSVDALSSPYSGRDYTPSGLYWELTESGGGTTNRLDQNLSYIKSYLSSQLFQPTMGPLPVANPRDWFVGACGYAQLALENPRYYRLVNISNRLDLIVARGRELTNFLRSLTFTNNNINWDLHTALLTNYSGRLDSFVSQVHGTEQAYADLYLDHFAVDTWRRWAADAPRGTTTGTAVTPVPLYAQQVTNVAAGCDHSLALRADGTVVGWGDNSYGQITIPASATNVVAIAAGGAPIFSWEFRVGHSLALRADGTVVGWGNNDSGQTTIPTSATNVVAIAAGGFHGLALKTNGTVVGWGDNYSSQRDMPSNENHDVVAIAAGGAHSLALRGDGTVVCWGNNDFGQTTIPTSATNVVAIAAGSYHSLALRADGTIIGWGWNDAGQTNIPPSATNVVAIAAGFGHSLALRADGTVVGWGWNDSGQVTIPEGLTNVVAISAGGRYSLALLADGTVVGWGENSKGQSAPPDSPPGGGLALAAGGLHSLALRADGTVVGWGDNTGGQTTIPANATNVLAIAAGGGSRYTFQKVPGHSLALRVDGTVVGWGSNGDGQTTIPANATNVLAIAAGGAYIKDVWGIIHPIGHSLALRADGTVVGWGNNDYGQTNSPASATNVVAIAAGGLHSLALRADGTVVGWGNNDFGQRVPPASATNVVAIAAGYGHSLALRADGTLVGWGSNASSQNTIPASATNVVAIAEGGYLLGAAFGHSLALRADGTVVSWGNNDYGQRTIPASATNVVALAAGDYHSLALKADGTVIGWGMNNDGQATVPASLTRYESHPHFTATADPRTTPDITKVAAGLDYSLGLKADGTVLAWGVNSVGQCSVPAALGGVADIAAGHRHSLALTTIGSVVAWGGTAHGETNVPLAALNNVEAIAAGEAHSLALRNNGLVVAWGCNNAGQAEVPDDLDNVVTIAAGAQHSLALKADSTVVAWGANNAGQANVPLGARSGVVAIAAGERHSLALLNTGEVVAWGWNGYGQANVPAGATNNVVAIAALKNHSLALKADGTVVDWGENTYGQAELPSELSNVVALAAGWRHNVFLAADSHSGGNGGGGQEFVLAEVPTLVTSQYLHAVNTDLLAELGMAGNLRDKAIELSGAKALLQAVLELGLPYTMERDDVLHGFFYGTEGLTDLGVAQDLFSAETNKLATTPDARPMLLEEVVWPRYNAFVTRLSDRLVDLQATGQPEIPRIVGHTLRLLNLLRDAWTQPTNSPPPTLEMWSETGTPSLLLYGEPYAHYSLQYRDSLSVPGWYATGITNLHNEQIVITPVSSPSRFFRALLPVP